MFSVTIPPLFSVAGLALAALLPCAALDAQAPVPAKIVGRVVDSRTGSGLADVGIQIVGTTSGAASGLDGRFTLAGVPPGTVTIHLRRLGFAP